MDSYLNADRPPAFCPGCGHDRISQALDHALQNMNLAASQIVIVSDIGCSGLFDTFFNTHALHGLHGRALTYATGLKMARPELTVIVAMGDGGLGIGGAHILAACRRNLDLTLLVLNNFNFGMTGGQFSPTTPQDARVTSGFLNHLEPPMDVTQVACAAGATYADRCSAYSKKLPDSIESAIAHNGFSVMDIWGICSGRYVKQNRLNPQNIHDALDALPPAPGVVKSNMRKEYSRHYREMAAGQTASSAPVQIQPQFDPLEKNRQEIVFLGGAGQRVVTAGEITCLAGLTAGLNVTQKNEYNITVLRGPSISDIILSPEPVGYTGITEPNVVIAIHEEGVARRESIFRHLDKTSLVIKADNVDVPQNSARTMVIDTQAQNIKSRDRALYAIAILASLSRVIHPQMLEAALHYKFKGKVLAHSLDLIRGGSLT